MITALFVERISPREFLSFPLPEFGFIYHMGLAKIPISGFDFICRGTSLLIWNLDFICQGDFTATLSDLDFIGRRNRTEVQKAPHLIESEKMK